MGKRKQRRRGITAQLVIGQDDDLIEWLESIEAGSRQQAIKTALRVALDLPLPAPVDPPEVAALRAELLALYETLQNGGGAERLQYIEGWLSQMADAYNGLVRRIDHLASLPAADITSPDPVEPVAQMSDTEQQQRASKLKKASW